MDAVVLPIPASEAKPWLLLKHYAKRVPQICFAFGLYVDGDMRGVVTYGIPANKNLNRLGGASTLELNRLCVDDDMPRNSSSFTVGRSLRLIPAPTCVVSYADQDQGHIGYIYQATNWLYTGMGSGDVEFEKDGKRSHRKALFSIYGTGSRANAEANGYTAVDVSAKHRYVFFVGNKREKKEMAAALPWPVIPYPKGETARYDAGPRIAAQPLLFLEAPSSRAVRKATTSVAKAANDNLPTPSAADLFANAA